MKEANCFLYLLAALLGSAGNIVLGVAILFACSTTSVGLVSSCGEYFFQDYSLHFPIRTVVLIVSLFSTFVANFRIGYKSFRLSVPVLLVAIYPLAIVIILLSFLEHSINGRRVIYIAVVRDFHWISSAIIDGLLAAKYQSRWFA